MKNRSRLPLIVGGLISAAIVLAISWYLISPLFINRTVNEALPTSSAITTATAAMQAAMTTTPISMNETMPAEAVAMKLLSKGSFYNVVHEGKGKVLIYRLSDGTQVLRFEDFQVLNGPDLHVYLVPIDPYRIRLVQKSAVRLTWANSRVILAAKTICCLPTSIWQA